ncbi:hypothetical protein Glove_219g177 [Diversispora epigaea]|uniref:DNA-directed DNA polymerase n=1 Tax=Diversispora epigaea TaxID=1348612 RepID=A0A397IFU7_9GLOM|nr:hypothetical protein Glove_219g177 [Diversispora epigaea]
MKVRNLLGAYAFKRGMVFSTRVCKNIEKGKYSGAYVFPPKKGIESKRSVTGLDFASLYPSLMMAYNLSPEKIISSLDDADIAEENGNSLHEINFPFNNHTIHAWCVRHNNQPEKKGLYPTVLEELFNRRAGLKVQLASLKKKRDQLGKLISSAKEKGKRIPEKSNLEYSSLCFDYNCLNSKQTAVKLYMNTFYGEAGNPKSPIFLRELAGGTTSAGQYNIKLVGEYVEKKGFGIKYGDTDSLYLTCPDKYYKECDRGFSKNELSKEAYWTEMVKVIMDIMKRLCDQVNVYLKIKSGTSYLKMAYEEVLFPVCFTGKKKYFGVGHVDDVNFKPKDLFIKGIDTVKQGKSQLFKSIGNRIMWRAMDIDNTHSLHEIVEDVLKEAITNPGQWDFDQFIETDAWKPNVDNKRVQRFIGRMRRKYENKIPGLGECFSYVMIHPDSLFDLSGKKLTLRKADQMEFADVAKESNKKLDLSHYFENTINGLCARHRSK